MENPGQCVVPIWLSCVSATLIALQHGGFVSREWLAAKGLLVKRMSYRFKALPF